MINLALSPYPSQTLLSSITFDNLNLILLSAGQNNTIGLWDLHQGTLLRMIELPQKKQSDIIITATVTPEGKLLIASIADKAIKIGGSK
jgi:WD40 repeat protein